MKRCNQPHRKEARRQAAQVRTTSGRSAFAYAFYADKTLRRGLSPEQAAMTKRRRPRTAVAS